MRLRGGGGSDDERASKRAKLGTILDTPPEVKKKEVKNRTSDNVDMRSASPVAGPSSSSAAPSSSAAGPGPNTPVAKADIQGQMTTPVVVHCHQYLVCHGPVHISNFAGGRNLQSSFGIHVAPGSVIDGNANEITNNQEVDSNEREDEEPVQRQGVKR